LPFPFILRSDHDALVDELRSQNTKLEHELNRLKDGVFKEHFGFQLFDTLPTVTLATEEDVRSLAGKAEEEEAERQRDVKAELRSRLRTRPSTVGPYLSRVMEENAYQSAKAAHPVAQIFAEAKQSVINRA
jgi:hypothetical protein